MLIVLFIVTVFLAYSNGANDNFKGVATLFGSKTTNYRTAIWWATITTFVGSMFSILLAETLLKNFSGRGLVPDAIVVSASFLPAVALAAGLTVMAAAILGFPISTTHALTGALVGSGIMAAGGQVNFANLRDAFFLPLLVSPLVAVVIAAFVYLIAHWSRIQRGVTKEWCICVGTVETLVPIHEPASMFARTALSLPSVTFATEENCALRYTGKIMGIRAQKVLDFAHFISAGSVSFARGLNDTPKIVALLLVIKTLDIKWGMSAVAVGMAIGGLLSARKVAITMSRKITSMTHGQGFVANFVTSLLVILASRIGLPVSTTHVSCGSLFGIGLVTGQADTGVILKILWSWILTLPIAAILGAVIYKSLPF